MDRIQAAARSRMLLITSLLWRVATASAPPRATPNGVAVFPGFCRRDRFEHRHQASATIRLDSRSIVTRSGPRRIHWHVIREPHPASLADRRVWVPEILTGF